MIELKFEDLIEYKKCYEGKTTISKDAVRCAAELQRKSQVELLKDLHPLDYISKIGMYKVKSHCIDVSERIDFVFDVGEFRQFKDMMLFYLACLADAVNPGFRYGIVFRFSSEKDKDAFDEKAVKIMGLVMGNHNNFGHMHWEMIS